MISIKELEMEIEMEYELAKGYNYMINKYKQMIEDIGEDEELFNTMLEYRSRLVNSLKRIGNLEYKLRELKK